MKGLSTAIVVVLALMLGDYLRAARSIDISYLFEKPPATLEDLSLGAVSLKRETNKLSEANASAVNRQFVLGGDGTGWVRTEEGAFSDEDVFIFLYTFDEYGAQTGADGYSGIRTGGRCLCPQSVSGQQVDTTPWIVVSSVDGCAGLGVPGFQRAVLVTGK